MAPNKYTLYRYNNTRLRLVLPPSAPLPYKRNDNIITVIVAVLFREMMRGGNGKVGERGLVTNETRIHSYTHTHIHTHSTRVHNIMVYVTLYNVIVSQI